MKPTKICNGFYKHKDIHRYTWTRNARNARTIINYFIRKQDSALSWNDVRVLRGVTYGSDHHLLRAKIVFPFRKVRINEDCEGAGNMEAVEFLRYNLDSLTIGSTRRLYQNRLDKQLIETQGSTFTEVYENIITSLHQAAKKAIGIKKNKINNKIW